MHDAPSKLLKDVVGLAAILLAGHAAAASLSASSCAQSAVQSAVDAAADGDTVSVPAGRCTWTGPVNVLNKTIVLRGAGSGAGGTNIVHDGGNHTLVLVNPGSKTGTVDISSFSFSGSAASFWGGTVMQLNGPLGWKRLRVHHNVFDGNYPWTLQVKTQTQGLIDHNTFKGRGYGILLFGQGPIDWATPLTLGTADFFFIEDNLFDFDDFYGNVGAPVVDMNAGGRQVFRYNTVHHSMWETHDLARAGVASANAYEVYRNTFTTTTTKWKGLDISAGTGVAWGNTFTGDWQVPIGAIDYKTIIATQPQHNVLPCDGTDPADQNVPGQTGWRCQYQIGSMGEGPTAYGYPLYLWNNAANGVSVGMQCTNGCAHLQAGRDFINNGSVAKPGYVPYIYPHPLQGGAAAALNVAAPTGLKAD